MPTCSNSGRLTLGFPWTLVRTSHPILVNLDSCDFRSGDAPKAAETERDALRLLPPEAKGGLHDELQHGLESFTK
jgi:hypothetical protein